MTEVIERPEQSVPVNPLLAKIRMPGTTFRLPSQGLFYENGELAPDVKNGEVEVYSMTAMDEIIFSTPDKLLSGKAIPEVFARCIPQVRDANLLLAQDVDYLMVCLRLVTFGPTLEMTWAHDCAEAKTNDYTVDVQTLVRSARQIDPTVVSSEYALTLENGQRVVLMPMTQGNLVELLQTSAFKTTEEMSQEDAELMVVNTFSNIVKNVDGITDKRNIREWLTQLPLKWKRELESSMQNASQWGVDFETEHTCKDCGERVKIAVSPNPLSFFI